MIDLKQLVDPNGQRYEALNFGRVKMKIPSSIKWSRSEHPQSCPTRVVDMANHSPVSGEGHISIEKKCKPVVEFHLSKGVVKGLTNRVKFPSPIDALGSFWASVEQEDSIIQDHIGLQLDTSVPLSARDTAKATFDSTTRTLRSDFSCTAELKGKIIGVTNNGSGFTEIPIENLVRHVDLQGFIKVTFQNQHEIGVN